MRLLLILISGTVLGLFGASKATASESVSSLRRPISLDEPSDKAFDPFLFTVLGDCQHRGDGTAFFRSTTNVNYPPIGHDSKGRDVVVYVRINLLEDHTYWAQYSEDVLISKSGAVTELQSVYFAELSGAWHIDGPRLVIDHVGIAILKPGTTYLPKATFTFTERIHDARALNHIVMIGPVTTDVGPHGESVPEFCHLK